MNKEELIKKYKDMGYNDFEATIRAEEEIRSEINEG